MDPAGATTVTVLGKYQIGRLLGRGNFAKVYTATSLNSDDAGAALAVKIIDKSKLDPAMAPRIVREVEAMRRLTSHPNILRIHEVLATKSKIHLVMDLAPAGDLFSKLCRRPNHRLPERTARRYLHQIASALRFSHRHGVAHRDLKPHNILLDGEGNVKLADFGLSAVSDDFSAEGLNLLRTGCGTPAFAAPEVFGPRRGYDGAKADAWSCGVILFAMLAGGLPFDDRNLASMYRRMNSREFRFPSNVTRSARALICQLLDPNPNTRLSVEEITNSPWFNAAEVAPLRSLSLGDMVSSFEKKFERAQSMNAFDLIGMNPGLNLSPLFDNGAANKERRFTSKESAVAVAERLVEVGTKLGFETEKGKGGKIWLGKGSLLVLVEVLEATPELVMVELKVVEGGGAEVVQWGQLRSELGETVEYWHDQRR